MTFDVGSKVRRRDVHSYGAKTDKMIGPVVTVYAIEHRLNSEGKVSQKNALARLSDGTVEYIWNLVEV